MARHDEDRARTLAFCLNDSPSSVSTETDSFMGRGLITGNLSDFQLVRVPYCIPEYLRFAATDGYSFDKMTERAYNTYAK